MCRDRFGIFNSRRLATSFVSIDPGSWAALVITDIQGGEEKSDFKPAWYRLGEEYEETVSRLDGEDNITRFFACISLPEPFSCRHFPAA